MSALQPMPPITLPHSDFVTFGQDWLQGGSKFVKKQAMDFGKLLDTAVGDSLAVMLGNIPITVPNQNQLQPSQADTVEVGPVRIVGGVRPQNFDVGYRPDGVRIAFDSKTLNDNDSVGKKLAEHDQRPRDRGNDRAQPLSDCCRRLHRRHQDLGLANYVRPLVSRGAQLSGIVYDEDCRTQDLASNLRTWILDAPEDLDGHPVLSEYVAAGERDGVHTGYKCSIRKPWWRTPSMWVPEAFMLRQIHLAPRVTANTTGATTTDTVHRVRMLDGSDPVALAVAFHNSATFAFTEVMGRSYGGGILELEPREAELLPMPSPEHVTPELAADVDMLLKSGEVEKALDLVDRQVLIGALGWKPARVDACRAAWTTLRNRRTARRR